MPKAKKKVKKKTAKKKRIVVKRDPMGQLNPCGALHRKKLTIMAEVPVVPCSAIAKNKQGEMYPHTQADKIFRIYQEKAIEHKLVFRMIECDTFPGKYSTTWYGDEKFNVTETPCTIANCTFEITDTESGQKETFKGSGMGDNGVWSAQSAQTVAFKQGLIMYFLHAWPQSENFSKIIRNELEGLNSDDLVKVMKSIIPAKTGYEIMTNPEALKIMADFFGQNMKKSKKKS